MASFLSRAEILFGKDKIESFENKVILIAGLGGVGGTALEALVRSGFKHFILVDFDVVDESNLNRQICYLRSDVGLKKVEVAKRKMLAINPNLDIEIIDSKLEFNSLDNFNKHIDFVVDAIDYVPGKLGLIKFACEKDAKLISSLGMGNRIDPEQVTITKLNKTEGDPLAKKIRYECKQLGLDLSKINVIFSKEIPVIKSNVVGSIITVPSTAGLLIAKFIISNC